AALLELDRRRERPLGRDGVAAAVRARQRRGCVGGGLGRTRETPDGRLRGRYAYERERLKPAAVRPARREADPAQPASEVDLRPGVAGGARPAAGVRIARDLGD